MEIVSIYPALPPPTLTPVASNRVCNAFALLQCVASHPDTRILFLNELKSLSVQEVELNFPTPHPLLQQDSKFLSRTMDQTKKRPRAMDEPKKFHFLLPLISLHIIASDPNPFINNKTRQQNLQACRAHAWPLERWRDRTELVRKTKRVQVVDTLEEAVDYTLRKES
ncbi:hypothetical protein J5N97_000282 [Dioscorea zingiberensis]|uniref:Uncharacterized protein n=1 Tax=Dioscorea zingiberensis TaxID=325984 RepID=A0A9D5H1M7_9LILI|nr:hypothetical protein J5N97_000282 [Dioscorea zingiberensis]